MQAAIDVLKNRRDLGCLYVHTTDYPMHTWPPEAQESKEHLARLDQFFEEAQPRPHRTPHSCSRPIMA